MQATPTWRGRASLCGAPSWQRSWSRCLPPRAPRGCVGFEQVPVRGVARYLLGWKLEAPVHLATIGAANRGLYRVSIEREDGSVTMFRPGISVATISTPYAPDQQIALPVRTLAECISEELRRLDPTTPTVTC